MYRTLPTVSSPFFVGTFGSVQHVACAEGGGDIDRAEKSGTRINCVVISWVETRWRQ